jgi:predicted metal-binding protein
MGRPVLNVILVARRVIRLVHEAAGGIFSIRDISVLCACMHACACVRERENCWQVLTVS